MTARILIALLLLLALVLPAPAAAEERILSLAAGTTYSLAGLLPELSTTSLLFVGELHSESLHHRIQLRIIQELIKRDIPVAVGLEMFMSAGQADLDRWVAGEVEEPDFIPIFGRNWKESYWPVYREIFLYARENRIPLIGLNVPSEITEKVAARGFRSLSPEDAAQLAGVSCDLDDRYRAFIRRVTGRHGESGRAFDNFCEAQMVWDTAMAYRLVQFARKNPETRIVVLAGTTHAWKHAIPEQVRRKDPSLRRRVLLPEIPGLLDRTDTLLEDTDYLWLAEP